MREGEVGDMKRMDVVRDWRLVTHQSKITRLAPVETKVKTGSVE